MSSSQRHIPKISAAFFARLTKFPVGLGCATVLLAASVAAAAQAATPSVDAAKPRPRIPSTLYGIFFDEINHGGEGDLYAEMVRNGDFEGSTISAGWRVEGNNVLTHRGWRTHKWSTNDLPGWSLVEQGGAEGQIALDTASPLNKQRTPHSLRITVTKLGRRCGVANRGFRGMNFQAGHWYELTFYARTEDNKHFGLIVSLESRDGTKVCECATIPEIGGPWKRYRLSLHARQSDAKGRLVITLSDPGTIWLNLVSLLPRDAFKNHPGTVAAVKSRFNLSCTTFSYPFTPHLLTNLRLPVTER